jgi:predicted O-linked N-acetylglucosamine transferase (SPINDLY family)
VDSDSIFLQAAAHHQAGRLHDAERLYRAVLAAQPAHPLANFNLGLLAIHVGKQAAALPHLELAWKTAPAFAQFSQTFAACLLKLGRTRDARRVLDESIAAGLDAVEARQLLAVLEGQPDMVDVHNFLGNDLLERGKIDEAIVEYRRALESSPDFVAGHNNLGNALRELGQYEAAVACFRRALEIEPDYVAALVNLGYTLTQAGRLQEAEACCRRALAITPESADAHYNLGNALKESGRLAEAEASYRKVREIAPVHAEAHNNLGNTLMDQGRLDEALESYRRALEIKPDYAAAYGNMLFTLNYHPDKSSEEIFLAYREYDALMAMPHRAAWRPHGNNRETARRLRVGYVSPDFRVHSCRFFLEPLLDNHDKSRVEVFAYAELAHPDEVSARYQSQVEHWIPTKGMSDEALAERIRADGIDILVELAGHTANNRLGVFARKPAPVAVSWLGYGYTTGLGAIDYYLSDEICVPRGSEDLFAERPWRIANPPYSYRSDPGMGEVGALPFERRGYITFGTLTRSVRVNHRTVHAWAEILKQVPNSRLVLDSSNFSDAAMQDRMAAQFAEHGITGDRLLIGFHSPPWDVLRGIDIGLDCFPHNSGTTLFESLYMGVPTITLAARPSVGRLGSSILRALGHPEWIADSEDDYVDKAVALAQDPACLAMVRARLRGEMAASPLMDEAGFARKVEHAYRQMWLQWCECTPAGAA